MLLTGIILLLAPVSAPGAEDPALDTALKQLDTLDWGHGLEALQPIDRAARAARQANDSQACQSLEARLLPVLEGAAPRAAKDYVCRQLALIGSAAAVPVLARLLPDAELAHMARAALEAMDDPSAVAALRAALRQTGGHPQIGVVQSLGTLRDAECVPALATLLASTERDLVTAVLIALGRIGSADALRHLEQYSTRAPAELRATLTQARLDAVARLVDAGQLDLAASICESLSADDNVHARCAALRGMVAARPPQAAALLLQALAGADPSLQAAAADVIQDGRDESLAETLAQRSTELPADGQARLLPALAARGQAASAVRAAALQALESSDEPLRHAALDALRRVAAAADAAPLARLATQAPADDLRRAAWDTLCRVTASGTNEAMLELARTTDDDALRSTLIRSLAERRAFETVPQVLQWAEQPEGPTRLAALQALQQMSDPSLIPALLAILPRTAPGEEREAADRALWLACQSIAEPAQRTAPLIAAIQTADHQARCALLPTLGRMGGEPALQMIRDVFEQTDDQSQDAAVRALANWPDASVADRLLEIARNDPEPAHRIWAVRAFARVVAIKGARSDAETVPLLATALQVAQRTEDKQLVLTRLATLRVPEAMDVVLAQLDTAELKLAAIEAVLSLADGMRRSHPAAARAGLERIRGQTENTEIRGRIDQLLWYLTRQGN